MRPVSSRHKRPPVRRTEATGENVVASKLGFGVQERQMPHQAAGFHTEPPRHGALDECSGKSSVSFQLAEQML